MQGVDFLSLPVTDVDRAVAFYRDTLGLSLTHNWQGRWAEFEIGDLTLALVNTAAFGMPFHPAKAGIIALAVADVPQAMAALQAKGVDFPQAAFDTGVCKMGFFSDPDGNALRLHHRYAPEAGVAPQEPAASDRLINGVDFVSLPAKDMARAAAFYQDVLGMVRSNDPAKGWPEYEVGGVTVNLWEPEQVGRPFEPNVGGWLALHVADVDAGVRALQAKGVTFRGEVMDTGVCKMGNFQDSEGNALLLHHRYAPEGQQTAG